MRKQTATYVTALYKLHDAPNDIFVQKLDAYLHQNNFNNHIFLGDININIAEACDETENYSNTLAAHGFAKAISQMTRTQHGQRSNCLDHIFFHPVFSNLNVCKFIFENKLLKYFHFEIFDVNFF